MPPKAHLTSHSKMSGSRCLNTACLYTTFSLFQVFPFSSQQHCLRFPVSWGGFFAPCVPHVWGEFLQVELRAQDPSHHWAPQGLATPKEVKQTWLFFRRLDGSGIWRALTQVPSATFKQSALWVSAVPEFPPLVPVQTCAWHGWDESWGPRSGESPLLTCPTPRFLLVLPARDPLGRVRSLRSQ